MGLSEHLQEQPKSYIVTLAILIVALCGTLEYLSGQDVTLTALYLFPIVMATLVGGRFIGVGVSLLSSATYLFVTTRLVPAAVHTAWPYVSAAAMFVPFVFITVLLAKVKGEFDEERERARTDRLTRLANDRFFLDRASAELSRLRQMGPPLTLAMVKFESLKEITERFGRRASDEALLAAAQVLQRVMRKADLAARMGGDRFAVLLPDTNEEAAKVFLRRLQDHLVAIMEKHAWPPLFRVGAATFVKPPASLDAMVGSVTDLMNAAESEGKVSFKHEVLGK
ncbi:MAG: GGDEF domain-containing protein [Deltaproteobacteria bacterium]|nr:GGDEF domain-containing protein [Deltaproteobacteria bacterium]